jgi:hypothetical protein
MAFRLPKDARNYFEKIMITGGGKPVDDKLMQFDAYYLCATIGFALGEILEGEDVLEAQPFYKMYPDDYHESRDYIAGLLIASEIKRRGIQQENARELEKLMLEYVNHETVTRLRDGGIDKLNAYAAKGMERLGEDIPKPTSLASFLVTYYDYLQSLK